MDVAIDERVQAIVHARRDQLEELVRAAVDREVQALVDAELARRNGVSKPNDFEPVKAINSKPPQALCARCGQRPRSSGRTVCSRCRHARARERQVQPVDPEPPHPGRGDHGD